MTESSLNASLVKYFLKIDRLQGSVDCTALTGANYAKHGQEG